MSTLEEQIDIAAPVLAAWEQLHRVHEYPRFVDGVRSAHPHGRNLAHLGVAVGDAERSVDTEITDRGRGRVMAWRTLDSLRLSGAFALLPLDPRHTRLQIRVEYDPEAVHRAFGGPRGFAQAGAIERTVRADLRHFRELVEARVGAADGPPQEP
ncbi:polyketide cyclase/dehydrase/lipid transport protein [Streptomyces sp. 1114.5]|uniref:SRPBCC family protein n=1 Tax=unclassified Streptomyces TaxID=2593676 RepID=UPI000BD73338|nr:MULTISPECIES: SRPBCC family protein [unclassified Streptomyces]RKT19268.1 polyketide cyclase/dehydrase/lipid transport protein [Streptomyces sp. 1114.5]SOB85465.1 Polyketide cyclase / dehydrase and lipid transport [Streptomyces sp. 1331.2]